MLMVGPPNGTFRLAAEMAARAGAVVTMADDAATGLAQMRKAGGDLVLMDVDLEVGAFIASLNEERMATPVIACGVDAPAARAVAAVRAGARDYLPLPPQQELIAAAIMSVAHRRFHMIGSNPTLTQAVEFGISMAVSKAPILIRGEMGVGKEVMARAIHAASRCNGHFVSVECQGISPEMLASELFGHETGAFEGAVAQRVGRLEEAAGGTVFLRGIGSVSPALQADLMDALRAGSFKRLGGAASVPFSARFIASTSRDLPQAVAQGQFRADLLARLALAEVKLPALRERADDIPALACHFSQQVAQANGIPFRDLSEEALDILRAYNWPANIRELEETIHRAMLLSADGPISPEHLVHADGTPLAEYANLAVQSGQLEVSGLVGRKMEDVERALILRTLEKHNGNRTSASSILGISVRTMRNKIKTYVDEGIDVIPAN
ncbi:sigma-54-dependent Fis family transcriptional regulator (plasmid) [Erythrobacter aureus]|uniref:Sigma-54-dependent Fis family transcriptional regulator n=2 Tax=Erythrobacter aureus TaxID=2182384 RepID=A0A345YJR4_9SPHN|nr:sigma-54-dependent Fis family transcriptional regulator [Erythrobacter aureus]